MKRIAEILKEALALPTEARAALAESLLASLNEHVDEDAETAWALEIEQRIGELDPGTVDGSLVRGSPASLRASAWSRSHTT